MGYGLNDSYFSPTKQQIQEAIVKLEKAEALIKTIHTRLNTEQVVVRKYLGLIKKTMTKYEHIKSVQGNNIFNRFSNVAYDLGYVTWEERRVFDFMFYSPYLETLREWELAESVFLCESDYKELIYALKEEL